MSSNPQPEDEDEKIIELYIQRMLTIYDDKKYECPETTHDFLVGKKLINRHASTLVLACLIKLFDNLIPMLEITLENLSKKKYDRISNTLIKQIYVLCAKTYIADFILYIAMSTPESDIFY